MKIIAQKRHLARAHRKCLHPDTYPAWLLRIIPEVAEYLLVAGCHLIHCNIEVRDRKAP